MKISFVSFQRTKTHKLNNIQHRRSATNYHRGVREIIAITRKARFGMMRAILIGIAVVVTATVVAMTRTKPFPCDAYLKDLTDDGVGTDPRAMGCRFRRRIDSIGGDKIPNTITGGGRGRTVPSVTQEGRIQRDCDTFFWSLFGNAFGVSTHINLKYVRRNIRFPALVK